MRPDDSDGETVSGSVGKASDKTSDDDGDTTSPPTTGFTSLDPESMSGAVPDTAGDAAGDLSDVHDVDVTRVVALDGPAGTGKSSVARGVAAALGWRFVDTGATYRAVTLAALRAGADPEDAAAVLAAVELSRIDLSTDPEQPRVLLNGEDVSTEIRGAEVTAAVSAVSSIPAVRHLLIAVQRRAIGVNGAVVEGRDIATVVAPQAAVKVFLDARPEVRAARRASDLVPATTPQSVSPAADDVSGETHLNASASATVETSDDIARLQSSVAHDLAVRDKRDSQTNPLIPSGGAVHVDTSDLTLEQVIDAIVTLVHQAGLQS